MSSNSLSNRRRIPQLGDAVTTVTAADPDTPAYYRSSESRAQTLWQYVSTLTGTTKLTVVLTDDHPTASIQPHPTGDGWLILVATRQFDQPASTLDRPTYDFKIQHALALHEASHALYTDFASLVETLESVADGRSQAEAAYAKRLFNAFEDGVINQCARDDFSDTAAGRLYLLNRNYNEKQIDHIDAYTRQNLTAGKALQQAASDIAIYDSGITEQLLDETIDIWQFTDSTHRNAFEALLPTLRDTHLKTITAPDAATRYEYMADCARVILDTLDTARSQPDPSRIVSPNQTGPSEQSTAAPSDAPPEPDSGAPDATAPDDCEQDDNGATADTAASAKTAESDDSADATAADETSQPSDTPPSPETDFESETALTESPHPFPADEMSDTSNADNIPSSGDVDDAATTRDELSEQPEVSAADVVAQQTAVTGSAPSTPVEPDNSENNDSAGNTTNGTDSDRNPSNSPNSDPASTSNDRSDGNAPSETTEQSGPSDPVSSDDSNEETLDESESNAPSTTNEQLTLGEFDQPDSSTDGSSESTTLSDRSTDDSEVSGESAPAEPPSSPPEKPDDSSQIETTSSVMAGSGSPLREAPEGTAADTPAEETPIVDSDTPDSLVDEKRAARQEIRDKENAADQTATAVDDVPEDVEILPDNRTDFAPVRWQESADAAERLRDRFEERLPNNRFRAERHGTPNGQRVDSQFAHRPAVGDPRCFKSRARGDSKRYKFVLVLDRSGSMRGSPVEQAESAVIQIALALERCQVDVAIIDFYDYDIRVLKPFELPASQCKHRLATGQADGRTPLGAALDVAIELLDAEAERDPGHIIMMTDDNPSDTDRYLDAFDGCRYAVHGALLDLPDGSSPDRRRATELYDTSICVESTGELRDRILRLAEQLVVPQ